MTFFAIVARVFDAMSDARVRTIAEISEATGYDAASVWEAVLVLERQGQITRYRESDGPWRFALTADGMETILQARRIHVLGEISPDYL